MCDRATQTPSVIRSSEQEIGEKIPIRLSIKVNLQILREIAWIFWWVEKSMPLVASSSLNY
jgi:hypothetical protein